MKTGAGIAALILLVQLAAAGAEAGAAAKEPGGRRTRLTTMPSAGTTASITGVSSSASSPARSIG
jgi:hypothetical protein